MPLIGSYSFGSASADRYSTVDELLIQLPDNTANLIVAQDIRDSVYTLWKNIEDVGAIAASAASASAFFQNANPTPVTVGGIPAGSTFGVPTDMQTMWNLLLYPYVAPGASLGALSSREYGAPLSVNLSWSAVRNSNAITSIIVGGFSQIPTGNSQTGVQATTGTHSISPGPSQTNTFNMSVGDGTSTTNTSTTLTWMNRIYWGYIDLSGIGNPDLTLNPGLSSSVAAVIDMTSTPTNTLTSLNGAGVGSGGMGGDGLSTSKNKTYSGINGGGRHLIFAWPSNVSGANSPTFTVNGLPNTAFTRVKSNSPFVNQHGFTNNYEVWVSNTLQNSPLNIVIS